MTAEATQPLAISHSRLSNRRLFVAGAILLAVAAVAIAGVWLVRPTPEAPPLEAGLAALGRGDVAAARGELAKLRAAPDGKAAATFLRASILLHKGYHYPALDELEQVQRDPRFRLPALAMMGQAWYQLGRHLEAQAVLHELLKEQPNSVDAHRWLAASYYDLGAIHDALQHLERTAELDPADPRANRLLGLIYKDYERYADAVPQYEESLRRKSDQPDATEIRQELATCQLKLRRHQEALATLAQCADLPGIDVIRAECHLAIGDMALAKQALERASEQQPENLDVLLLRGTMLLEEGQAKEAVEVLERAAQAHPRDYTVHFKLAQAYAQAGQPDLAAAEQNLTEEIRKLRQEFADLHQAAWNEPHDAAVRLRLVALAQELDRPDLAEVWLKSAAALQPLPASAAAAGPQGIAGENALESGSGRSPDPSTQPTSPIGAAIP